jgi:hypothetical protein
MGWIDLPQDVKGWRAAVNVVKKYRVPKILGIS